MSPRRFGRFEVIEKIGAGGMGTVYLAQDPTLGRKVAIKTIIASDFDSADRDELLRRLLEEGRNAANLRHSGIVTVYDADQEGDETWIVMEHVVGTRLSDLLKTRPSSSTSVRILREIAEALDYAHEQGVIHRDIKPDNILLEGGEKVRIVDFGIAKSLAKHTNRKSGTLGTPHYMSPEQVWNRPEIDGRADQFSLAVIAYFMLTGKKPFEGDSIAAIAHHIANDDPLPASSLEKSLPSAVDKVIQKALSKEPDHRYATCVEFVQRLESALSSVEITKKKSQWWFIPAAALLLTAFIALAAWLLIPRPDPSFILAVYGPGGPIQSGKPVTLDAGSTGLNGFSAVVTADHKIPSGKHLELALASATDSGSPPEIIERAELHDGSAGMKREFRGALAPGEYLIRLTLDKTIKKDFHFSVVSAAPPPPPPVQLALAIQIGPLPLDNDGQKFNKKDPEYPKHIGREKLGTLGRGDITATVNSPTPLPSGTSGKLAFVKDGATLAELPLALEAVGTPQPLDADPGPGDYTVRLTWGENSIERHFTILPLPVPAPPKPSPLSSVSLTVFSRTTKLTPGQQFGFRDKDLGQLDGKDLIVNISGAGQMPRGSTADLLWLVNGGQAGKQAITFDGTSVLQAHYPNPIPLPGQYVVKLAAGSVSKEFTFTINQ